MKTEYQGRLTPHWHFAAWVVSFGLLSLLQGRSGTKVISLFVKFLETVFHAQIDVQIGNGRLNYINGYVSKDHDAIDVGLGEYMQKSSTAPWLATYRLLSKSSPGIPEVAIRMAQLPEFEKSYSHVLLYPPQPEAMIDFEGRQGNFSSKMYGFYLQENRTQTAAGASVSQAFLPWHRTRQYDTEKECISFRGGRHQQAHGQTLVVACRFWYELTDGYCGQFSLTMFPHLSAKDILPQNKRHLKSMQNFVGALQYLSSWTCVEAGVIGGAGGIKFDCTALPMLVDDQGQLYKLDRGRSPGDAIFQSSKHAFDYFVLAMKRDLQYRGLRDDRMLSFELKQDANYLLAQRVERATDEFEYERLRQEWDTVNRPKRNQYAWSSEQQQVLLDFNVGACFCLTTLKLFVLFPIRGAIVHVFVEYFIVQQCFFQRCCQPVGLVN